MITCRGEACDPEGRSGERAGSRPRKAAAIPRRAARGLIRLYQFTLSPWIGRTCRYMPSCSEYVDEAIARHGLWAGGWMGVARLARCNPLGGHGFDPVKREIVRDVRWYTPWRYGDWRTPDREPS